MTIPHTWDLSPDSAVKLQRALAGQINNTTPLDLAQIRYVAGVDVSVKENISRAAIVVQRFPELVTVEAVTAQLPTPFPYISGLLSFREGEVILQAHEKLEIVPDVYIFDGQGIAHPRRIGIASHMGLWFDRPTIGCAKKRLTGKHTIPGPETGNMEPLVDHNEVVGMVVRTRTNVKPVYVSVGHRATLETACDLIMRTITRYRLPEPIRAAHNTAGDFKPGQTPS